MLFTLCAYSKGPIKFIKRSRSWFKCSLLQLQPLLCNMLFRHAISHSRAASCISRAYVVVAARSPVRCDTWSSVRRVVQKRLFGEKRFFENCSSKHIKSNGIWGTVVELTLKTEVKVFFVLYISQLVMKLRSMHRLSHACVFGVNCWVSQKETDQEFLTLRKVFHLYNQQSAQSGTGGFR